MTRRRVDLLRYEADHSRLSPLAVIAGRRLAAALEGAHRSDGSPWCPKVDTCPSGDGFAATALDAAHRAARYVAWAERQIGVIDVQLVGSLLADGASFADLAERNGRSGRRAVSDTAKRFRDALERLASAPQAIGAVPVLSSDKYADAAKNIHRAPQ